MRRSLASFVAVASLAAACAGASQEQPHAAAHKHAQLTSNDGGAAALASGFATDSGATPACGVHLDPPPKPRATPAPDTMPTFMYMRDRKTTGGSDVCAVADDNLASAERAILAGAGVEAPIPKRAWDRATPPAGLDRIDSRFRLTSAERAMLAKNGFVVPARLTHSSYARAYHDIFQSQLPIFVSVDSILHAIYASNDELIATIEDKRLRDIQTQVIDALACALPDAARSYPPAVAKDLDLYLTVARSLAAGRPIASTFGVDDAAKAIVEQIDKAEGFGGLSIFGRGRTIDWSAYRPRGHYAHERWRRTLEPYFRTAMWLSRLELNLVTRSCPSSASDDTQTHLETPREEVVALALADLAAKARATDAIAILDDAWGLLAGKREDVSLADLNALRGAANIADLKDPDAAARLRAAIGARFPRKARLHYVPDGCGGELSAITTLLGPRVVADTTATRALGHPAVDGRYFIHVPDMAYALGHDRAKLSLTKELSHFKDLARQLEVAREIVQAPRASDDLYAHWFEAIAAIARRPDGVLPSFMDEIAYKDLRMNSAIAAFGQIRHNYVLVAGHGFNEGGCEIPDGYVEPAPAVYDALIAYARRGEAVMKEIDPNAQAGAESYFAQVGKVLATLKRIGDDELAGRPLSREEKRFLSLVTEMRPATSDSGPTYTGWYFDMFRTRSDALDDVDFIADFYTSVDDHKIAYAGASSPRLGVFVVDTGGGPRAVIGPITRAYEYDGPLTTRLDDESAKKLTAQDDPWAASYTVAAKPAARFAFRAHAISTGDAEKHEKGTMTLTFRAPAALGGVTIELLDHHFAPFASIPHYVAAGKSSRVVPFMPPISDYAPVRAVRIRVGEQSYVGEFESWGADERSWGFGGEEPIPYSWGESTTPP